MTSVDDIAAACAHRGLHPDGEPIRTAGGALLPVRTCDDVPAMVKWVRSPEEAAGVALLEWWDGDGAVRVLGRWADLVLMERAMDPHGLLERAVRSPGSDDAATAVICRVLSRLHAARAAPPPALAPLDGWFADLRAMAARHGGVPARCARVADELLADPGDVGPLHGDCHHSNVLEFGESDWRAVDPKDRFGERAFDHAAILVNPDLPHAADPVRLRRQVTLVSELSGIAAERLIRWAVARAGLSAAWFSEDGDDAAARRQIAVAETALRMLPAGAADR